MTLERILELKRIVGRDLLKEEIYKVGFYSELLAVLDLAETGLQRRTTDAKRAARHRRKLSTRQNPK